MYPKKKDVSLKHSLYAESQIHIVSSTDLLFRNLDLSARVVSKEPCHKVKYFWVDVLPC